jgi:hypothetical protein
VPISKDKSPTFISISTALHSALPPIPKDSPPVLQSKMSAMAILRRPVGGAPSEPSKTASVGSFSSSVYSDSPGFSRSLSNSSNKTKDSQSGIDSESGPTPPLPPKDSQRQQLPETPKSTLASTAEGFQTSPPRPEIWRRRSVKSDRSIVVPELRLNKSNGSTASPPRQLPPERELPAVPSQLPRSLQGRKPVPVRPAPPQPDTSGMGIKLSKLRDKHKRGSSDSSENAQPHTHPTFTPTRLPTPEYLKTDKQQPMTPQVQSPETPPHDLPPVVPQKSESRNTSQNTLVPDGVLADTTNRPNLLSSHSRDTSETLTITSEPQVMRSPQPKKAYAAKILTPQPSPPVDPSVSSPLVLPSPAAPSNQNTNIKFPKFSTPASPGTVLQGPEIGIVHFECYQNHKLMRSSKNVLCPTACMICKKKEGGPRWRCSWCCLSACGACMQVLTSVEGRDLRVCVERVGKGERTVGHDRGRSSGGWSGMESRQ